jgi:hypothetical protein
VSHAWREQEEEREHEVAGKGVENDERQAGGQTEEEGKSHLGSDLEGAITDAGYDPLLPL